VQIREELGELLELLQQLRPKVSLEIGTADGGTLFLWTRATDPQGLVISVDKYPSWKTKLFESFGLPGQALAVLRADSHNKDTLDAIVARLSGKRVDFLFIDGDHSYEGVKRDFEMYGPLVRVGGLIAFHDIVPGPVDAVGGVPKLWSEIKTEHVYREIISNHNLHSFGIGVIFC
jgi:predicted O-methyltransferase YrrM